MTDRVQDNCYQTVKDGYGGFDDMTVSRTIAMMLNQLKVPTIESSKMCVHIRRVHLPVRSYNDIQ